MGWMMQMMYSCSIGHGLLLVPHNTFHEGRIYQLKLFCGEEYPDPSPTVRFQTGINRNCFHQETGTGAHYGGYIESVK
ncbi:hypothetical protein RJ639_033212, partial [Escallonia herrerae]